MRQRTSVSEQKGGVALMVAVGLLVFLAFTAMATDIALIQVTKNELHNVADAAALAGARRLGAMYEGLASYAAQQSFVLSAAEETLIKNAVHDAAGKNRAGGTAMTIDDADIRIGQWNATTRTFTVTTANPDAVEVTARRDATANGPITTLFAKLLGINTAAVVSTFQRNGGIWTGVERPVAALTGVGEVGPGELELPVGISQTWFTSGYCDHPIRFFPTSDPIYCAGWHTFNLSPPSANTLRNDILQEMPPFGSYAAPGFSTGDSVEFIGGNVASALPDLKALYDANKNADGVWETLVVVYQGTSCSNPNSALPIVGFASVAVTNVLAPPDGQLVEGTVKCNLVQPDSRGGGAEYGTKGSIPGLVQ